ncbi:lysine/arginine permease [Lodderomyces elongisporus NRRL YB-4239]|uniref:Lysine/arginine permease n=1 Tax=Lodderomyces elongisporus (strain ATCC 11503 / CBS 2605 / JCM 1781 / NBRC 1676 / NRRL YB-4239) TaxID=379508 RepID=A5E507_LODEL|nr:lysine/arginine permease [Lodderomyces elongisporus NRRL YB-4239]
MLYENYEREKPGLSSPSFQAEDIQINPLTSYKYENKEKHLETDYVDSSSAFNEIDQGQVQGVKRGLASRHISMIALGGTIGTGLFISTGGMLADAGPILSLISFLFMTTIAFSVTQSLGEMATLIPVSGSFAQFVTRWVSRSCGAANGWLYWFSWAITFALELSVVGQVVEFWTYAVPLAAWISIFFVIIGVFNLFPVKYYGEVEFWVASIKVLAVFGWIIYALVMVCGGGKTGPVGFRYWRNGYGFNGILVKDKATSRFLAFVASFVNAAFTFQGTELVGISAGESANPRKSVPAAIRKVLIRILLFYVLCMFFMGLLVPYNDPKLQDGAYTSTSPFIIAMENSGTKVLPHIFNAVILTTIISAANSNVYCGSRIIYGLAEARVAPRFFLRVNRGGVPYLAVLFTTAFGALGYLACSTDGANAFNWLLNITATAGLICWGFISVSHIRFMNVLKKRGISRDTLPYKALFMPYSAYYATFFIFLIVLIQGFQVFFDFNATGFFTAYISLILFVVVWIFFQLFFHRFSTKWSDYLVPLDDCDIDSGVREIDEMVWDDNKPKNLWQKFWDIVA